MSFKAFFNHQNMKMITNRIKAGLVFSCLILLNFSGQAQDEKSKIYVGDKAPKFKYGTWLKGSPIKDYKQDHLYIFEFWATWCGPCIASMPHLSKFAKANAGDVTVIAVNIWEDKSGKVEYESLWPKVT